MLTRRGVLRAGASVAAAGLLRGHGLGDGALASDRTAGPGGAPLGCDLTTWQQRSATGLRRPERFTTPLPRPERRSGPRVALELVRAEVEAIPGHRTPMLTYDGAFPGPTLVARVGEELVLDVANGLDEGAVVHLHGTRAPAAHDGHVRDVIAAGDVREYRYPNRQLPATLWYHDHLLMRTAERIYRGLAGAALLLDPGEADLGLPVGDERDVEVLLTDRAFQGDGQLRYPGGHHPVVGDVVLVNGADRPRLDVAAGRVRLRLVNASNARAYRVVRADGVPLVQIGTDGGLLGAPTERDRLEIWPAERIELLLDLHDAEVGTRIVLADQATGDDLFAVDVVDGPTGMSAGPLDLPALAPLDPPEVVRTLTLDEAYGRFLINGHGYADDVIDLYARLGAVERWRLVNTTTSSHPMHLHLVVFRVRSRAGSSGTPLPLRPEDDGWKDTVLVRPFETVELDARFAGHLGDFMVHCHVLEHEDHDMMSQFRVVDLSRAAGRTRVETAALVAAATPGPRARAAVAGAGDWQAALAGAALADALLLADGDALDPLAAEELRRVPPDEVVVVGGAVSTAVEAQLAALAPTRRIAGADPVETAAVVAVELAGRSDVAVLATDAVFADALAAGVLGVPVLLTPGDALAPAAREALRQLGVAEVVIAGGPAAVSVAVEAAVRADGYAVSRVAGPDRTATAAAFARRAGLSTTAWAASADRFPDALGAAVAARRTGAVLVLVGDAGASPATADLLAEAGVERIRIAGGEAAVTPAAERDLAARLPVPDATA